MKRDACLTSKKTAALSILLTVSACAPSPDLKEYATYLSNDGMYLHIDYENDEYHYSTDLNAAFEIDTGDFGGRLSDCSNREIKCVALSETVIAVPESLTIHEWHHMGREFVASEIGGGYRIEGSSDSDRYIVFYYSRQGGVQSFEYGIFGTNETRKFQLTAGHALLK